MAHKWGWGPAMVAFGAVAGFVGPAQAHFILQEPAAMTVQNEFGDPQKAAPCGHAGDGELTGEIATFSAGETITVMINEVVFHPGHYRVALALDDEADLPDAPPVTPGATDCGSTVVQAPPVFPVIADGELEHATRFDEPQSFSVTLPDDVECDNCTLQVIQFMSDHAAPCYYYHCATIAIEGAAATTTDGDDSSGESDPSGTSNGDDTTGDSNGDETSMTNEDASAEGPSDSTASTMPTASAGTASDTDVATGPEESGDGGCGCSTSPSGPTLAMGLSLLALGSLRRRRVH